MYKYLYVYIYVYIYNICIYIYNICMYILITYSYVYLHICMYVYIVIKGDSKSALIVPIRIKCIYVLIDAFINIRIQTNIYIYMYV
jgi:hypothetical protein